MNAKEMIHNGSHGHEQQTFLIWGPDDGIAAIEKQSFQFDSTMRLDNERNGTAWYLDRLRKGDGALVRFVKSGACYAKLSIPYVKGVVELGPVFIVDLQREIQSAIDHYHSIFSIDNFQFSHGDLFLGNIVFRGGMVERIIDWEHFNSELPRGYDLCNFITEMLLTSSVLRGSRWNKSIDIAKRFLRGVGEKLGLEKESVTRPLQWCQRVAAKHGGVWGEQISKLPHQAYNQALVDEIDGLLAV